LPLTLARPGMGLALATPSELESRHWNADVYTSYSFGAAFALYGRLGYKQAEALPAYLLLASNGGVPTRQGVNYGVGLRYDMSPTLGLKLEYARFGRFAFDTFSGAFPESDQVQIGVQYRF
jgi:opacity protein-like surface antigen